jgi:hypothetical protein
MEKQCGGTANWLDWVPSVPPTKAASEHTMDVYSIRPVTSSLARCCPDVNTTYKRGRARLSRDLGATRSKTEPMARLPVSRSYVSIPQVYFFFLLVDVRGDARRNLSLRAPSWRLDSFSFLFPSLFRPRKDEEPPGWLGRNSRRGGRALPSSAGCSCPVPWMKLHVVPRAALTCHSSSSVGTMRPR